MFRPRNKLRTRWVRRPGKQKKWSQSTGGLLCPSSGIILRCTYFYICPMDYSDVYQLALLGFPPHISCSEYHRCASTWKTSSNEICSVININHDPGSGKVASHITYHPKSSERLPSLKATWLHELSQMMLYRKHLPFIIMEVDKWVVL